VTGTGQDGPDEARTGPGADDPRAVRLRWLARAVVFAIGLYFVADGLSGLWSGGDTLAAVLIGVAVVLGLVLVVLGVLYLSRRGRSG